MATYYARNVTGNWASNTSWDSASSGGAGPAGPPVAGDTAIFDSGFTGNITIAASAACAVITVQAGATGTLTYGANQPITTTGNVTLATGFNIAGTGIHRQQGTVTYKSAGLSFPNLASVGGQLTLADNLSITGYWDLIASNTIAGAFNVTCDTLRNSGDGTYTLTFVAGQTVTVSTAIQLVPLKLNALTVRSSGSGAGNETNITFNGAAADAHLVRITFTDVDFNTPVYNWRGGTLTNTTNITNVDSTDIGGGRPAFGDRTGGKS